jgi:hypothetical protein
MGLFAFLFGNPKPAAAAPPLVPLDALEDVKDKIVAASGTRSDWSEQVRARIAAKAKEVFYMTLAARDFLHASSLDRGDIENVRILAERMTAAADELVSTLNTLGPEARDLRRELEKALRPCSEAIRQRLLRQDG